jgi:hypothetical protein
MWSMLFSFNQELRGCGESRSVRGFLSQAAKDASPCDQLSNRPWSSQTSAAWEPGDGITDIPTHVHP